MSFLKVDSVCACLIHSLFQRRKRSSTGRGGSTRGGRGGGGGGEGEGRKIRRKKVFVDRLHDVFSPVQTPYFSNVIGHGPKVVCSMVHCLSGL